MSSSDQSDCNSQPAYGSSMEAPAGSNAAGAARSGIDVQQDALAAELDEQAAMIKLLRFQLRLLKDLTERARGGLEEDAPTVLDIDFVATTGTPLVYGSCLIAATEDRILLSFCDATGKHSSTISVSTELAESIRRKLGLAAEVSRTVPTGFWSLIS